MPANIFQIFIVFLTLLLASINYPLAKLMVNHTPPLFAMGCRCLFGGLFFIGFTELPSKQEFKEILKISLNQFTLNFAFFSIGIRFTSANLAVLITQIDVPMTIILSIFLLNENFQFRYLYGFLLAITGIYLVSMSENRSLEFNFLSLFFLILSSFFYSISVIQIKKSTLNIVKLTSWGLISSAMILFVLSCFIEKTISAKEILNTHILFSLLLAITSTCVFILWSYLIRYFSVAKLSSFLLLVPIFSLFFNAMLLNEAITFKLVLGTLITFLGVSLFHMQPDSKKTRLSY